MSFAKFANTIAPLNYRPDTPKEDRPKPTFPEPYLRGSVLRVIQDNDHYRVGDCFIVEVIEPSFDPQNYGDYFYEDEGGDGTWSNYVECIEG